MKRGHVFASNWYLIVLCGALAAVLLSACDGQAAATAPPTGLAKVNADGDDPDPLDRAGTRQPDLSR